MSDASFAKPTSQLDLEERLARGNEVEPILVAINPNQQGLDDVEGYVGTDPIYQNYANETEKPYAAEGGAEAEAEALHDFAVSAEAAPEPDAEDDAEDEESYDADSDDDESEEAEPKVEDKDKDKTEDKAPAVKTAAARPKTADKS